MGNPSIGSLYVVSFPFSREESGTVTVPGGITSMIFFGGTPYKTPEGGSTLALLAVGLLALGLFRLPEVR